MSVERFKVINWPCPPEQGTVNEASGRQTQKHRREKAEEKVSCGDKGLGRKKERSEHAQKRS